MSAFAGRVYQKLLPLASAGKTAESVAALQTFDDTVEFIARKLESEEARAAFIRRMERVRDDVNAEYETNRQGFLERLGVSH